MSKNDQKIIQTQPCRPVDLNVCLWRLLPPHTTWRLVVVLLLLKYELVPLSATWWWINLWLSIFESIHFFVCLAATHTWGRFKIGVTYVISRKVDFIFLHIFNKMNVYLGVLTLVRSLLVVSPKVAAAGTIQTCDTVQILMRNFVQ